mgnify:FL=1
MLVVRNRDGKEFALLIERGKHKAQVKTYYATKKKQSAPMSDAHSPERNVRNDSAATVSSISNIAQDEAEGKTEDITYIDAAREENQSFYQSAWHGTPHDFDGFDLGAIGTGEDAQVHGEISEENGKRVITLFESADESTFMHEMGHMFLISRSLSYFINLL